MSVSYTHLDVYKRQIFALVQLQPAQFFILMKQAHNTEAVSYTHLDVYKRQNVSRQTISNWENEKSYPDIIDRIDMSNLYSCLLYTSRCV